MYDCIGKPVLAYVCVESELIQLKPTVMYPTLLAYYHDPIHISLITALSFT